jgi:uncharacterized protein (DUF427 family)
MEQQTGAARAEPAHRRVRILFNARIIADTTDAYYVWENPSYPHFYVPMSDIAAGTLQPTATTTRSQSYGTALHFTVRGGDTEAVDAAWCYTDSPVEALRERVRFDWNAMDAWFEEDEEIFVHPRNPSTRVEILRSSRHVTVAYGDLLIAESDRPTLLFETGLPRRTYIPKLDVRMDLLVPTATVTGCPYKGRAAYWSLVAGDVCERDIAWSYPSPVRESAPIANLLAFYDHRVDVHLD